MTAYRDLKVFVRGILVAVSACTCAVFSAHADAFSPAVKVPAGYELPVHAAREVPHGKCASAPSPFMAVLDIPSKYEGSDASRSTENPEANARYQQAIKPIAAMEKGYAAMVRKYVKTGDSIILDCSMRWLNQWAEADALMNRAPTHTGRSIRKWALGSLASSYLRLARSSTTPLRDELTRRKNIEAWFGRLADRVISEWPVTDPIDGFNNHYYWSAWAITAAAAATDRRDLLDSAMAYYQVFGKQVDSDGYLPAELSRRTRALSYHAYALGPLSMIAAFAKVNNVAGLTQSNSALNRLAMRTFEGLNQPVSFDARAGAAQDPASLGKRSQWNWLEPYCWAEACGLEMRYARSQRAPHVNTRLGGDLTALFSDPRIP